MSETKADKELEITSSSLPPSSSSPWQLHKEEWEDERVLQMVQACRTWNEGNEVSIKTIIPFIYNLMEVAYDVLADHRGQERKRILLAVLLHSLETKDDWASEDDKQAVIMVVQKAGAVILNFGNVSIKDKILGMITDIRETAQDCVTACGCIPYSK